MYTRLLNAFVEAEVLCGSSIYDVSYCCSMFSDKRQRNWENKSFLALFHVQRVVHITSDICHRLSHQALNKRYERLDRRRKNVFWKASMPCRVVAWKLRRVAGNHQRRRRCLLSHFLLPLSIIDSLIFYSPLSVEFRCRKFHSNSSEYQSQFSFRIESH